MVLIISGESVWPEVSESLQINHLSDELLPKLTST